MRLGCSLVPCVCACTHRTRSTKLPVVHPVFLRCPCSIRAFSASTRFVFNGRLLVTPIMGGGTGAGGLCLPRNG